MLKSVRTRVPHRRLVREAVFDHVAVAAEQSRRSFFRFMQEFWDVVSQDRPFWNWHIPYLCSQLEIIARRVAASQTKLHDLIINVPPGTTKSITCSVMFPDWCWTNWPWMRFIVGSYSSQLSLDHAEMSRDLVRSDRFRKYFPYLDIKQDKDTKSNFRITQAMPDGTIRPGGNRFSTSVGGTVTGFHAHILIVDDPLNPKEAVSDTKIRIANHWMEQTLSTRKVDKAIVPTVLIMQRLHQDDPTGHMLAKGKTNVFHICLPGEILEREGDEGKDSQSYAQYVRPVELVSNYTDGFLDPVRMPQSVLSDLEIDLGPYGYASQIGQNPVPPGGGMFQVDHFQIVDIPPVEYSKGFTVRYWDKAGTDKKKNRRAARTASVKMTRLKTGKFLIIDAKAGQWATDERERIIRETAEADGPQVTVFHEQEPGSGGKDSAQATTLNLAGFNVYSDRPTGDKATRADPYSVQVNSGNVFLLKGEWNHDFIEEHRFFPFGRFKDQVDAGSGAFTKVAAKRAVRRIY